MSAPFISQRFRPTHQRSTTHRYVVGQTVRLKNDFTYRSNGSDIYHITSKLPLDGALPQYRVRNDKESHERVTTQDKLELVDTSSNNESTTLIEKAFGHV